MSAVTDSRRLEAALVDLADEIDREARDAMESASARAASKARELAPVKLGDLRESIVAKPAAGSFSGGSLAGGVTAGGSFAEHAPFIHEGTRAHEIRARGRWHLRFAVGGQTLFRRRVWHPGTRANPFLERAVEVALIDIGDDFQEAVERAIARAGLRG